MNMKEKHSIIRRALSALTAALIACSCTLPLQASASGSQLELGDKFDQYISTPSAIFWRVWCRSPRNTA